jgi:hypothetical protein
MSAKRERIIRGEVMWVDIKERGRDNPVLEVAVRTERGTFYTLEASFHTDYSAGIISVLVGHIVAEQKRLDDIKRSVVRHVAHLEEGSS